MRNQIILLMFFLSVLISGCSIEKQPMIDRDIIYSISPCPTNSTNCAQCPSSAGQNIYLVENKCLYCPDDMELEGAKCIKKVQVQY